MKPIIFVMSGNYQEYTQFLSGRKDLIKFNVKYLSSVTNIYGLPTHACDVILTGNFRTRGDYKVIREYLDRGGFEVGEE